MAESQGVQPSGEALGAYEKSSQTEEHQNSGEEISVKNDKLEEFTQKVDVDHILKHHAGNLGFVQIAMVIASSLTLPAAIIFPVFGNAELPHRCRLNQTMEEYFTSQFKVSTDPHIDLFDLVASHVGPWPSSNTSIPVHGGRFGCERYRTPLASLNSVITQPETLPCDNGYVYKYTPDQYPGGIVVEWDLVCDQAWKAPFSTSMYMGGMLFGFILGGMAGDHFGRRLTALFACILEGLTAIAVSLSPFFGLYILFRVLLAFSTSMKVAVLLVLCMELTTAHQRSLVNGLWSLIQGFLLRALLSPLAFWFQNWRWLHGAISFNTFLSFPTIFFFPESPRWLVSQQRKSDALHELYKVYRVNQRLRMCKEKETLVTEQQFVRKIQDEARTLKRGESKAPQKPTANSSHQSQFRQMLKTFINKRIVRITAQCVLLFSGQLATTFGLIFYGSSIRSNIYLVNFLNSATQVPATIISGLLYRFCKRRKKPIAFMYLSTCIVLTCASVYNLVAKPESDVVLNVCCNLALILQSAAFNMVFMYVPELFPSEARALGLGIGAGLGRVGGVLCPFINSLDSMTFHGFPIIIYVIILLLEMLNLAWLPDTSGRNLLDNLEQKKTGDNEALAESEEKEEEEGEEEEGRPIWASTVDELVASTQVICSNLDRRDGADK
ncbi:unnamed protein product [Mesocestoides corti]|uniref:MFS domain-containing protein n=1 Tax=Mesocestoides corti TaxID=53468 RepID=A0A0R3U1B5_MESCO|nr:unnamed protein product [Mesocestoides corti]